MQVYPILPGDDGVKIQPEKMEKEKLYHIVFKDKVLLFYKDVQEVLNCYEIEEEDLVQKIKMMTDNDEVEKFLEQYIDQKDLKH
jgi:hypothetical protein